MAKVLAGHVKIKKEIKKDNAELFWIIFPEAEYNTLGQMFVLDMSSDLLKVLRVLMSYHTLVL